MFARSNNQSHPLWKIIKVLLISLAILTSAGLAQHLWGRWKLASVKRDMARRGQMVDLRTLPTNSVPGHTEFSNQLHQIAMAVGPSFLSGGGNQVLLSSGMAARGSQAPTPIAYDTSVVFTNGFALLQSTNTNTWVELKKRYLKHAPEIAELRRLLQDPPKNIPGHYLDTLNGGSIPNFIGIRQCAQILNDAAICELHKGNLATAEENLVALAGFTALYCEDPNLVSQMIRVAIEAIGTAALWDAMHADGWSEPQLRRLQKAWTYPPAISAVVHSLHIQRLSRAKMYEQMRIQSYNEWAAPYRRHWEQWGGKPYPTTVEAFRRYVFHPIWSVLWAHEEIAGYLERSDHQTSVPDVLLRTRSFANIDEQWEKLRKKHRPLRAPQRFYLALPYCEWDELKKPHRSFRHDFSQPIYFKALTTAAENQIRREITVTAIALTRYKLKHGRFPEALTSLTPEFLSELPVDWMDGQRLRYKLNALDSYTLYSVGRDGSDNCGDPMPVAQEKWETRDIVWLTPVPWQQ